MSQGHCPLVECEGYCCVHLDKRITELEAQNNTLREAADVLGGICAELRGKQGELRSQLDRALSELVEMRKHSMEAYRIATEFLAEPPNTLDTKALVLICTELEAIDADRKPGEPVWPPNELASGKEVPTDTKSVQGGRDCDYR